MQALAQVTAMFVNHDMPARRYDNAGAFTNVQVPFKLRQFSPDTKRKTAAYDRIGITVADSQVRSTEVALLDGDYIILNQGSSKEALILVAKLVQDDGNILDSNSVTEWACEGLYCNARIDVDTMSPGQNDDGVISSPDTLLFSDIPASIVSAEFFWEEPFNEPKDEFFLTVASVMEIPSNSVITINNFADTSNIFQHQKYQVLYAVPDSIGATRYRLGLSAKE